MRPVVFSFPAADADGIALAQQLGAAGNLILNGALIGPIQPGTIGRYASPGIQRQLTLTSAGNLSTVNFAIVGTDLRGTAITEIIAGPNASTVTTVNQFATVTQITASGPVGTDVTVGTASTGVTNWYESDLHKNPTNMTLTLVITATADVTVQDTPVDVQARAPLSTEIFNHPTLAAVTASAESNYAFPPRFVRAVMNSSSGAGAFDFTIIQPG
jgi:hypothetical protein